MGIPGMDGIEFLQQARKLSPDTVCAMLTGNADQQTTVRALNEGGVHRFLNKPCTSAMVIEAINACIEHFHQLRAHRQAEEKAVDGGIRLLTQVLHAADPQAPQRAENLMEYVRSYYNTVDPRGRMPRDLELAVTFSSIGLAIIPAAILRRARTGGALTTSEEHLVESASEMGGQILGFIPHMENASAIVRYQAKGFDGSGYPKDAVCGEELPFGSRLLRVMSDLLRLEAEGLHRVEALARMSAADLPYDPEILKVCRTRWRPTSTKRMERICVQVPVAELCISDVLARPLHTISHIFLAPEGTVVTKPLMRKIRQWERLQMLKEEVFISIMRPSHPEALGTPPLPHPSLSPTSPTAPTSTTAPSSPY